jgi:hypothetical protein
LQAENADLKTQFENALVDLKNAQTNNSGFEENLKAKSAKCRELIALSQSCIAKDHLAEHQTLTTSDRNSTTLGLMLKYEGNSESKVTIDFVLIGTPAWNSKKIHKGDVLVAVDGNEEKGEAMIAKLLGAHGTSVILTIKKEGGDEPVDVELQRMATSLVADKRKMFDLFTAIEHRFLMDKDMIGKKYNDDALAFWTQMCMEEIDQDNRYVCLNPKEYFKYFPWTSTGLLYHSLISVLSPLSIFFDLSTILTDVGPMWR